MIKPKRMGLARHAEIRNAYKMLVVNSEEKGPLARTRRGGKDENKVELK
jgi:hypothetical protein